jgi:diguanylate cyclase (GGDEF)-like protein/PAS domain S-box-containing protein
VRQKAWLVYLAAAATATAVYFFAGHSSYLINLIGISSPILILVAMRLHRPSAPWAWRLLALGQFLFIAGDVVSYNYFRLNELMPGAFPLEGGDVPFPGIADLLYLAVYPCLVGGLMLLVRARNVGRDRASLLDSLMLTIGIGTISWVLLISPYIQLDDLTLKVKLTAMAYPMMDLLLLAVGIRLAVSAGRRPTSFYLVMAAISALFVTDAIYAWFGLYTNGYQPGSGWLEAGWIAFYVLIGMAALHPSMRELSEPTSVVQTRMTVRRLMMLAVASMVAPVLMGFELWRGSTDNMAALVVATIAMFALAVARMWGLVRTQQAFADREKALREAGAALVTATNREGIHESAIGAVRSIVGTEAAIRVCDKPDEKELLTVVSSAGGLGDAHGVTFDLSMLQEWKRERLLGDQAYTVPADDSVMREPLMLFGNGSVFVAPLFLMDQLHGLLVVGTDEEIPTLVSDSLRALSSQVALALESAALTEDLLIKQSEARFASLVRNANDVVTVVDPDSTIRYASPSSTRVLGVDPGRLEGTRFVELVHDEDRARMLSFITTIGDAEDHASFLDFRLRHADGSWFFAEALRTNLLHDPNVKGIVLTTRDVSERKAFEEQLSRQAFHDSVTDLANRVLFRDRVEHALERQERDSRPIAVLFMDLDDFKTINDSLGHAAGDQVLREVGERLAGNLRAADTAARLGGDEFAVLLEDGGDGIQAADVAERVIASLEAPFQVEGKEVFVRGSIGIAVIDPAEHDEQPDVEAVLRNADVAMYMAKENGKNRYQMFEAEMHATALRRLELKADLQRALEHGEFVLHYQPVIELETGRVSGVEALLRWMHPERGIVPPLDFIPLAEETGLIVPIGEWVLREACRYASDLHTRFPGQPAYHMAVNLSAKQLARPEIVDDVRGILAETGLDPACLTLEITESVMMADMELSIERLTGLKSLGVQLAIDDFGTGYSSLNYVRRFPVDILKVDKSFIDGVSEEGESSALTAAVIELAGILNLKPVAEGIERMDQLERLLELHCALGQGYYFAKPLEGNALESLLSERAAMEAEAGLTQR